MGALRKNLALFSGLGIVLGSLVGPWSKVLAQSDQPGSGGSAWVNAGSDAPPPPWSTVNAADPRASGWQEVALLNPAPGDWQQSGPIESLAPVFPDPGRQAQEPGEPAEPKRGAPVVMALSRGITVNRVLYPDASLTVPNGFKRDPQRFLTFSLDATNQVRRRDFFGCRGGSTCPDIEFNGELALIQAGPASLELLYTVGNVVSDANNSTGFAAQQLGFRLAANIAPNIGLAIGGESLLELDDQFAPVGSPGAQLKGRTLFAVASAAFPLSNKANPPVISTSLGVGNGYYGYRGTASDSQWGPFGSLSFAFNDRIAIGVEYSGYAVSAGVSVRPVAHWPLTASVYATDFLGNFPNYIQDECFNEKCSTRYIGRFTYSF
jgi:hypothetical protein